MIEGIGIDIVSVGKFESALQRWGGRFLERLFTPEELSYCMRKRTPAKHLAARFAAKTSIFRAMGRFMSYRDVEIALTEKGSPTVRLKEPLPALSIQVSISHDGGFAVAETIIERKEAL